MYEASFRLNGRPFLSAPRPDRYFPAASIEAARQLLARCIDRAEGVSLLVGPSGTGKSLLLTKLAEQFRNTLSVALLSNTHLNSRRALLQAVLFQLNLPYRGLDEGELRLSLLDHLTAVQPSPRGLLLMIDEAHTLPVRLLEEVRMITNLANDGLPRVRLVLAGNAALEERLAAPKLASLAQRITARGYLQSLNAQETEGYIFAQIASVGAHASAIFGTHALRAVFQATDGVPRLINQLCDHALVMAFAGGRTTVDSDGIQEAWSDLQQLPTPWNEASSREDLAIARKDDVVEFGTLAADDGDFEPKLGPAPQVSAPLASNASVSATAPLKVPAAPSHAVPLSSVIRPDFSVVLRRRPISARTFYPPYRLNQELTPRASLAYDAPRSTHEKTRPDHHLDLYRRGRRNRPRRHRL